MAKTRPNYQNMQSELDEIMIALQQPELDVDQAIEYYQRGLELIAELEDYLENAENKVKEIKAKFNS